MAAIFKFSKAAKVFLILSLTVTLTLTLDLTESGWTESQNERYSYADVFSHVRKLSEQQKYMKTSNLRKEFDKVLSAIYYPSRTNYGKGLKNSPQNLMDDGDDYNIEHKFLQYILMSAVQSVADNTSTASRCANDTGRILVSLSQKNESWAIQFIDAAGKPGPGLTQGRFSFIGDYHQCRSARAPPTEEYKGFSGNYCSLRAKIALTPGGLFSQQPEVTLGACLPDSCTSLDATLIVAEAIYKLGLNGTLQPDWAECQTPDREMTAATKVSIFVLVVIGTLMILGTAYDVIFIQWPKWEMQAAEETGLITNARLPGADGYHAIGPDVPDSHSDETTALLGKPQQETRIVANAVGAIGKVLVAFSVYTNGSKALNTYQPPGSLGAIHGIRFLSMSWVILGHMYAFGLSFTANVAAEFTTLIHRWTFDAVSNALVSVDTFFTLSGLLTAYLTLKEMKKKGWNINWPLFYFHRFWRLTPPYMLSLLMVLGLQQYLGSGALWVNEQPVDKKNCEDYWWANMLYINNLIDLKYLCFGHSWYLSNDMQFFILSPLMLIPFYFNKFLGMASCLVFLLTTWITTGTLSTIHNWPPTLISTNPNAGGFQSTYFTDYYITPWCRIGPYVIGILAGFLLAITNGGKQIKMSRSVAAIGWVVATAVGLACVYGLRGDIGGEHYSSTAVAAFYNAVARSAWGACVCWVIIACVSGYGGFVNTILSWSPFVALGRLTYMAYLIHPCLIYVYFQNHEQPFYMTDTNLVVAYCGVLVLVNMVAFVLMLGFESPMIGLEKTFLRKPSKD